MTYQPSKLTRAEEQYFRLLLLDIEQNGGFGEQTVQAAIIAAHDRRQSFLIEMMLRKTPRAKMAAEVIEAKCYGLSVLMEAQERALRVCQYRIHEGR